MCCTNSSRFEFFYKFEIPVHYSHTSEGGFCFWHQFFLPYTKSKQNPKQTVLIKWLNDIHMCASYSTSKALRLKETPCDAYTKWVTSHDITALAMHARSKKHFPSQRILFIKSPCNLFDASVTLSMRIESVNLEPVALQLLCIVRGNKNQRKFQIENWCNMLVLWHHWIFITT